MPLTSLQCSEIVSEKYKEYEIDETPYVVVKAADAGTYGMGIMTVRSADRGHCAEPQTAQQDECRQGRPGG
ncbi:MAG: glutamate--cysteine ligase [Dechloromonas sp.]|uniref:Glutamate--cysteine ligase n=1 Tax=Candidatus Dechloromonas phosphorivorans TaxID=2899244 RepID=A0A9D7LPM8_9RHOO|nr:glutamate--cysteine ligase [Candidatus Dechloromonas phosphorivorans]